MIHRDLKPGNTIVSSDGVAKLLDFGTAFDMSQVTHTMEQTLCGTPAYVAPEVVRKAKHTTASDIWSFGVLVYSMVNGDIPFKAKDGLALLYAIARGQVVLEFPDNCPLLARDFITRCLAPDSRK